MAQSAKLQLRQTQGLALTPQLMQSIKLLQMNSVELRNFVQGEIEKNPLLELAKSGEEFPEERRQRQSDDTNTQTERPVQNREIDGKMTDWGTSPSSKSTNDRNSASGLGDRITSGSGVHQSASANDLEAYIPMRQSLRDILLQQAALTFRTSGEIAIARGIIDLIDTDGYLRGDLGALCDNQEIEMPMVTDVLARIQKFDPPGVGARDLAECMRLQLAEKNRLDPAMELFTRHLNLLAKRDYRQLAKLCGVDNDDLIDMAREVQMLEPRPGAAYDDMPVQNIVADVFVSTKTDGSWLIELNSSTLPSVLVNRDYYAEIKMLNLGKSDKKFMVDNLQSANWLVASLDQRARTILKVATEIVKQQDMFFVSGEEHLKPLTLKTVAEQIEMHESTISRVTGNKYISCERGIFEFKYFFMSGTGNKKQEGGLGSQSIRAKIKKLIEAEHHDAVLSDEKLAKLLRVDGINIARRTVTKYRESLGLQSSVQRRREMIARLSAA